jgi:hypothetical protein
MSVPECIPVSPLAGFYGLFSTLDGFHYDLVPLAEYLPPTLDFWFHYVVFSFLLLDVIRLVVFDSRIALSWT